MEDGDIFTLSYRCFSPDLRTPGDFLGVINALFQNLVDSSYVPFHKDSESPLNSKITFSTKESILRVTVELSWGNIYLN